MRLSNVRQPSPTVITKATPNASYRIQMPLASGTQLYNPGMKTLSQQNFKQQTLIIGPHHKSNHKNDPFSSNDNFDIFKEQSNGSNNIESKNPSDFKSQCPVKRRRTYQPQGANLTHPSHEHVKTSDDDNFHPISIEESNSKSDIYFPKCETTSSFNNFSLFNKSLKKKENSGQRLSNTLSTTTPPMFTSQKFNGLQSKSINKFKSIQFNVLNQSKNIQVKNADKKNETTIKILILSNYGNDKEISCSEIDILGANHFPLSVNKIYVEPLNHSSTKITKLINRDMIKNEKKDMWYAKWPPSPPLQKISLIIKVDTVPENVDSMRFWPTTIDPTANIKSVEIYVDNDPVFKGDLPRDFGQVIPLKCIPSDSDSEKSLEYEYEYENDNPSESKNDNKLSIGSDFKVDFGYSNNMKSEISQNYIKKKIKKRKSKKENEDETGQFLQSNNKEDLAKIRKNKEKMRIKMMKDALNKIRSSKERLSNQAKGDEYGLYPNPPIQNIEIRCFDSYESTDYFGYSWIRIFDSDGNPIDVRSSASIMETNCGLGCPPASVLFHEDENSDIAHFDLWRGELPKCENLNSDQINQGLNSGNVLVHFTDLTLVSAIVLYTFRHPKDINLPDISAKRVRIYVENKQIWAGRLKRTSILENDPHSREDDCATVVFLMADPEVQNNVLSNCFPSIYS